MLIPVFPCKVCVEEFKNQCKTEYNTSCQTEYVTQVSFVLSYLWRSS